MASPDPRATMPEARPAATHDRALRERLIMKQIELHGADFPPDQLVAECRVFEAYITGEEKA